MNSKLFALSILFCACRQEIPLQDRPANLLKADLDGDQRDDLIVVSRRDELSIEVFLSGDDFSSHQYLPFAEDGNTSGLGDLDGDGDLDLVAIFPGTLQVLQQQQDHSFVALDPIEANIGDTGQPRLADANRDGSLDLVMFDSGATFLFANNGLGELSATREDISSLHCFQPRIQCADLDNDGDLDEVGAILEELFVLINQGDDINFVVQRIPFAAADEQLELISTIEIGDIDGDGDLDIVTATDRTLDKANGEQDLSEAASFSRNNGDGTFRPFVVLRVDKFVRIKLQEITGDEAIDILTFNTQRRVTTFSIDGQSDTSTKTSFSVGNSRSFEIGSVTAPGATDLILLKRDKLVFDSLE
jgi:hypothetical protein